MLEFSGPGRWRLGRASTSLPPAHLVPSLVEELCDYVNDNWDHCTALHLAAFVMWRLNWVHPFADGNGRTSRTVSYVVLSIRAGYVPSGTPSIPDQNRIPNFEALEAADEAWKCGALDISKMESLLGTLLARQLTAYFESVGGKVPSEH
jgi:hypothetical protein